MAKKPIALIIMDGYGINQNTEGNAIVAAKKPHLDKLLAEYPHSQLSASGLDVGLLLGFLFFFTHRLNHRYFIFCDDGIRAVVFIEQVLNHRNYSVGASPVKTDCGRPGKSDYQRHERHGQHQAAHGSGVGISLLLHAHANDRREHGRGKGKQRNQP